MEGRRISSITVWASDLEASARFYSDFIGLGLDRGEVEPPYNLPHYEVMWGDFDDDTWFLLHIYPAMGDKITSNAQIGVRGTDLDGLVARATEMGVQIVQPMRQEPWGRNAKFADPDGNVVSVTAR